MNVHSLPCLALLDKDATLLAVDFGLVHDFDDTPCRTDMAEPLTHTEIVSQHNGSVYITTTLYELISSLQSLAAPGDDAVIVSVLTSWICTGRLRSAQEVINA